VTELGRKVLILGGSTAVTAGLVALSLWLGGWAYQTRSVSLHDGRLRRLLDQKPTLAQVREGLAAEAGNREIASPATDEELSALAARWSPARAAEVVAKRRRWASVLVFAVQDVLYVVYFDREGKMADYVFLPR
jgi:hypothetical protein